ncbi:unnamed protein product [Peronospora effusa]|nr:unnamed protein product [Peronospora effusa]
MMGLLAKTPAVLSLNGQPQVTLHVKKDNDIEQIQHGETLTSVGESTLELMKLLGSLVRLRISDGRVIVGRFHCFDKHQNVILKDGREFAPTRTGLSKNNKDKGAMAVQLEARDQEEETRFTGLLLPPGSRSLGMTLVPGKHIVYMKSIVLEKLSFFFVNERIDVSDHLFYEVTYSIVDIVFLFRVVTLKCLFLWAQDEFGKVMR